MKYILNVTPEEYDSIQQAWAITGPNAMGDFRLRVSSICSFVRLPIAGEVQIVVRRDVRHIPWYSVGVERLAAERQAKGER